MHGLELSDRRLRRVDRRRCQRPSQPTSRRLEEPLLLDSYATPSPRGHFELTNFSAPSAYRPPAQYGVSVVPAVMHRDNHDEDRPVYVSDHLTNQNPAVDLAWPLLSHGCCWVQCVRTQELGFTENCGAFQAIIGPGCYCMLWPYSTISGRLSLRIQQLDIDFLQSYEAFYRLADPAIQIQAYVLDVVRATVPTMTLDEVFSDKNKIADYVFVRLHREMIAFGYEITSSIVTNVVPNARVREAMNEMNASRRLKESAPYKAEARKIEKIKAAEAQAEAHYLSGVGTAKARGVIAAGMREAIGQWTDDVRLVKPAMPKDAMNLLLVMQYLDVLSAVCPDSLVTRHDPAFAFHLLEACEKSASID